MKYSLLAVGFSILLVGCVPSDSGDDTALLMKEIQSLKAQNQSLNERIDSLATTAQPGPVELEPAPVELTNNPEVLGEDIIIEEIPDPSTIPSPIIADKQAAMPPSISFAAFTSALTVEAPEALPKVLEIRRAYDEANREAWNNLKQVQDSGLEHHSNQIALREELYNDIDGVVNGAAPEAMAILRQGIEFRNDYNRQKIANWEAPQESQEPPQ